MGSFASLRAWKTPSTARNLAHALGVAIWLSARLAIAGEHVLDEAEVIRLAKARSPASAVYQASDALATANIAAAGPRPNPSLQWSRETIETTPSSSQDIVSANIPLDLARPRAARSLAAADGEWLRAEASQAQTQAILQVLLVYYDAVVASRRVELHMQLLANLDEATRVLERRLDVGAASGYETTRLVVASELARSELVEARAGQNTAVLRLAALLDLDPRTVEIPSELPLRDPAALDPLTNTPRELPPALRHARAAREQARTAVQRAAWTWVPSMALTGGVKHVSDFGGGVGYAIGFALDIPLFDRGQAIRAQADATQTLNAARADALARSYAAEARAAHARFAMAHAELNRFDRATVGPVHDLLQAAAAGYREGERSVVELLDAQRTQAEVAERRLELFDVAKRAEAQLRAATGDLP